MTARGPDRVGQRLPVAAAAPVEDPRPASTVTRGAALLAVVAAAAWSLAGASPSSATAARSLAAASPPSATTSSSPATSVRPPAGPALQDEQHFGYRIGEERRYVLDPPRARRGGEYANWSLRLDRVEGDGPQRLAVFVFEHERDELISDFVNRGGRIVSVRVSGEVRVNPYGFPMQVTFEEQQIIGGEYGDISDLRTTVYRFTDKEYRKEVRLSGQDFSFGVPIARHDGVDLDVPRGLYLFLPRALSCLGQNIGNRQPQPMTDRGGCGYSDPVFANPGLLSLAMPALREASDGEADFAFFMPSGVGTRPAGLIDMRRWIGAERDAVRNLGRYYERIGMKLEEQVEVAVGPRTLRAWKVDIGGPMRDAYVDDEGRVLRIDIDPHPRLLRDRWIRLLFPSEY